MDTPRPTPARTRFSRPARGLGVGVVLIGVVFGLGPRAARAAGTAWSNATNPAVREADQHAHNAANAMLKRNLDEPASAAAAVVVGGSLPGDTIEALVANGTTRNGQVVLRITVLIPASGFSRSHQATRCYRYDLRNTMDDFTPHQMSCPDRPAIAVKPLPPPAQLPARVDTTLSRTLKALTAAQRSDPVVVRAALKRAYGSPAVTVETAQRPDGTVGVAVFATTNPTSCLGARLPVGGPPEVVYPARVAVQPGELGCSASWFAVPNAYDPPH